MQEFEVKTRVTVDYKEIVKDKFYVAKISGYPPKTVYFLLDRNKYNICLRAKTFQIRNFPNHYGLAPFASNFDFNSEKNKKSNFPKVKKTYNLHPMYIKDSFIEDYKRGDATIYDLGINSCSWDRVFSKGSIKDYSVYFINNSHYVIYNSEMNVIPRPSVENVYAECGIYNLEEIKKAIDRGELISDWKARYVWGNGNGYVVKIPHTQKEYESLVDGYMDNHKFFFEILGDINPDLIKKY